MSQSPDAPLSDEEQAQISTAIRTYSTRPELEERLSILAAYPRPTRMQRAERAALTESLSQRIAAEPFIQRGLAGDASVMDAGRAAPNTPAGHGAPSPGLVAGDPRLRDFRTAAMRVIEARTRDNVLSATAADRLDAVLRTGDPEARTARYLAAVGDPAYASAFATMIRDPLQAHLRFGAAEVAAVREASAAGVYAAALETGSTGFPLPITIDPSITITSEGSLNPIRSVASVITVGTHNWKGVSSDGVTAEYVAEGTEATDDTPALAAPQISTERGQAFVQYTIEAAADDETLAAELQRLIADGRDQLDATKFLTGTGTNEPAGVLTGLGAGQQVSTAVAATFAVGDAWALKAAIPSRFMANTTFAAAPATLDTMYRFVGGGSTEPPLMPTRDGPLMGRPAVEWSTMDTGATTTGDKLIIGGDFRTGYKIVDRIGMSVELVPHVFGTNRRPQGVRGLYAYWRTGAGVVAANALRVLVVK